MTAGNVLPGTGDIYPRKLCCLQLREIVLLMQDDNKMACGGSETQVLDTTYR
jgi:hypothetical protein